MGLRALAIAAAVLVPAAPARAGDGGAAPGPPARPVAVGDSGGASPGGTARTPPQARPKPRRTRPKRARVPRAGGAAPRRRKPRPRRPPVAPAPTSSGGRFPIAGPHSYGGRDGLFGASRRRHVHQGQDVSAPSGTPLVAPRGGRVVVRGNQPAGAGLYYVIAGDDGRHYVLMHLLERSMLVPEGARVRAGQPIGAVGSTGASTGAHLHFEIWVGGWRTREGIPIDPLPELRRWDAYS